MTTEVMVIRLGGNKDVKVIKQHLQLDGSWKDVSERPLTFGGNHFEEYVYDTQRLVIEETGEFKP